jgi:hypothetical protein
VPACGDQPTSLIPMKATIVAMMLAVFILPAEAAKRGGIPRGPTKRDKAEEKREQKEREARERKHEAVKKLLEERDGNHDGSLSKDEFLSRESDKEAGGKKFDDANKNGDRLLSKSEIEGLLGL